MNIKNLRDIDLVLISTALKAYAESATAQIEMIEALPFGADTRSFIRRIESDRDNAKLLSDDFARVYADSVKPSFATKGGTIPAKMSGVVEPAFRGCN